MTVMRVKYIHGVRIVRCPDGLWRDDKGTIIALAEDENSKDKKVRCGVGRFSLPEDDELTDACRAHDFKTSSPAYMRFHNRSQAEDDLARDAKLVATTRRSKFLAPIISFISRMASWAFWDDKRTRWK